MQTIALTLEYAVAFTRDAFAVDNRVIADTLSAREPQRRHRVIAFVDASVAAAWPKLAVAIEAYTSAHGIELVAPVEAIPGGETAKDAAVLDAIWKRLAAHRIDRHSFVLAIGGGSMLDVVGYAAATLHRGVRLVRMPTTVLAQNDAGIGVKNGINAFGAKNFLGTFAAPYAVINDSQFLATLEPRDRAAGMAEAVKVALIRDAAFFRWLAANAGALARFEPREVDHMIRRCAELHLAHIATGGDPFEHGNARPLDFGHWAAHKLEMITRHALRHGEAVAIGMALDARYAVEIGMLAEADFVEIVDLLVALRLPVWHDALHDGEIYAGLAEFREHLGGELCITLVEAIGRGVDVREVRLDVMARAIDWLAKRRAT